jgi:hypothetical protein
VIVMCRRGVYGLLAWQQPSAEPSDACTYVSSLGHLRNACDTGDVPGGFMGAVSRPHDGVPQAALRDTKDYVPSASRTAAAAVAAILRPK